jgi:hypothetical protein
LFHLSRDSDYENVLTEVGQGGCVKQGLVFAHGPVLLKNTRTHRQEGINHFVNYVL